MTDRASKVANPYSAPESHSQGLAEPPSAINHGLASFAGRVTLLLVTSVGHIYFWAMLLTWTMGSISGQLEWPTRFRELTMYSCALVCVLSTGVVLYAAIRRLKKLALMGIAITGGSLGVLVLADWYG